MLIGIALAAVMFNKCDYDVTVQLARAPFEALDVEAVKNERHSNFE